MNKAEVFHQKVLKELETYTIKKVDRFFKDLDKGDDRDAEYFKEIYRLRDYPCLFYSYLACAVRVLGAKQCVEIGADRGASALMMASEGATVYSNDIRDGWEFVPNDVTNIIKLCGDSRDMKTFGGIPLGKTDLWLIDGSHYPNQVREECKQFMPFWHEGTVVLFDDLTSIEPAFTELPYDKIKNFAEIHGPDESVGEGILVL